MARSRSLAAAVVTAATFVLCACGSSSPSSTAALQTRAPLPAGPTPSEIAKMVCAPKAQHELAEALGVNAVVQGITWVDHRYSCRYTYPDGFFTMSVQELSSWSQTYAYFHSLGASMGDAGSIPNLGQAAFSTSNGSVVVRKDWKVLLVDDSGLPAQFGVPPTSAGDAAATVADVILGCWDGD